MKVRIDKYPNYFGPYQLAEKLMFWVPKEKDEYGFPHTADRVHKFGEWLAHGDIRPERQPGEIFDLIDRNRKETFIYKFLLWIDGFKNRKVEVRIDPWDTWSMDHTLAYIILPMLKQLRSETHGSPFVDDKDVPRELRSTSAPPLTKEEKETGHTDANHHKRWEWVLDEMIFAFESKITDDWESQFETGENDIQWKQLENGMSEMIHGDNHTKTYDVKGRENYAKRINRGFLLFGKYYNGLWS